MTLFSPVRPQEHTEAAIRTITEIDRMIHTTGTHPTYRAAHIAARAWLRAAKDCADDLRDYSARALLRMSTARAAYAENVTAADVDREFDRR